MIQSFQILPQDHRVGVREIGKENMGWVNLHLSFQIRMFLPKAKASGGRRSLIYTCLTTRVEQSNSIPPTPSSLPDWSRSLHQDLISIPTKSARKHYTDTSRTALPKTCAQLSPLSPSLSVLTADSSWKPVRQAKLPNVVRLPLSRFLTRCGVSSATFAKTTSP